MSLELLHHSRQKKTQQNNLNLNLGIIYLCSYFLSLVCEHLGGREPIPQCVEGCRVPWKQVCSWCLCPGLCVPAEFKGIPTPGSQAGLQGSRCAAAQLSSNSRAVWELGRLKTDFFSDIWDAGIRFSCLGHKS